MKGSQIFQSKIERWAKEKKNEPFLLETGSENTLSYEGFFRAVFAFRELFESEESARKTIVLALPGGIIGSVVWMAALTGGHLLVPVSPFLTEYEFEDALRRHRPNVLVSDREDLKADKSMRLLRTSECLDLIKNAAGDPDGFDFAHPASEGSIYLSSSGSTGQPKGMILSAEKIAMTAIYIGESHKLTLEDRGLTPLPFYHVNAPVVSLATAVITGSSLVIAPKFSATNFWKWIEDFDPTWVSVVPAIVAILLKTDRPIPFKKGRLRFMRSASAPLPAVYLKRFEKKFGIPMIETYGLSEAASTIAANPVPPGVHKAGSVGLPIGVSVRICRPDTDKNVLKDVPKGAKGEICIQGDNVISSYEEGVSKDSFCDGWFRTGDKGYIDSDGYIFITGRIKDVIIRGGENIDPREIEELLLTDENISEVAVVGRPDPIYGEEVAAFVVLNRDLKNNTNHREQRIQEFAGKKLNTSKVPKNVYILPELPKGKTGKVSKKILRSYFSHPNGELDSRKADLAN